MVIKNRENHPQWGEEKNIRFNFKSGQISNTERKKPVKSRNMHKFFSKPKKEKKNYRENFPNSFFFSLFFRGGGRGGAGRRIKTYRQIPCNFFFFSFLFSFFPFRLSAFELAREYYRSDKLMR